MALRAHAGFCREAKGDDYWRLLASMQKQKHSMYPHQRFERLNKILFSSYLRRKTIFVRATSCAQYVLINLS